MITKPTVLVLGAGASFDYNYPIGSKLAEMIVRNIEQDIYREIILFCDGGITREHILDFKKELWQSQKMSIDSFLERNPKFQKVGKLAIAISLMDCEDEGALLGKDYAARGSSWYHHLFEQLDNEGWERFIELSKNLTIITFNYDRSLEHFLFEAFRHSYGEKKVDAIAEALGGIQIIHVHGSLGPLPWQASGGRPYNKLSPYNPDRRQSLAQRVSEAGDKIIIASQAQDKAPEFLEAHRKLKEAMRIYFLGFGYDPINLSRLLPNDHKFADSDVTHFRGTSYRLGRDKVLTTRSKWPINFPDETNDLKITEFLKSFAELN